MSTTQKDQYTKADPSAGEPGAKPLNLKWPGLSKDMEVSACIYEAILIMLMRSLLMTYLRVQMISELISCCRCSAACLLQTKPDYGEDSYRGSDRLKGKRAVITGGDSGTL
jgi:hypothetical protein